MPLPLYQVDAFTSRVFAGNPAAVCPLEGWLDDATLQAIATENNLSETAFLVRAGDEYAIRWFTPAVEVDLCGHATLASAHVVFTRLEPGRSAVRFRSSQSGVLDVTREGERLVLDFPARPAARCGVPAGLAEALGRAPRETWLARDLVAVFAHEDDVRALRPDLAALTRAADRPWPSRCPTAAWRSTPAANSSACAAVGPRTRSRPPSITRAGERPHCDGQAYT